MTREKPDSIDQDRVSDKQPGNDNASVPQSPFASFHRVGRAVLAGTSVVFSLLAFPSVLPWMIAMWLSWHTLSILRGRLGAIPLVVCLAVLLVKGVYWPASLIVFGALLAIVALVRVGCVVKAKALWRFGFEVALFRKSPRVQGRTDVDAASLTRRVTKKCEESENSATSKRFAWVGTVVLWIAWGLVGCQWRAIVRCDHPTQFDPARSVVCVGDSLTSGVLQDGGYPAPLGKLLRVPVVNLGQPGITTQDGLDQVPRIIEANPQVVVIELGGHDFLLGRSRAATKKNLEQLIAKCRAIGAEVVLVEIPRGFIVDPFAGMEREIAHQQDLELVPDTAIRQLVLWSPAAPPGMWFPNSHLSDDGLHSNARGSRYIARRVARALQRMYGPRIKQE